MIVGFVAAAYISYQRTEVENANKTVDLAIDYEALLELADREGASREDVLKRAKDVGFTSLAVYETTFKKFKDNGKITAVLGADILKNYERGAVSDRDWQNFVEEGNVVGTNVYVMGKDNAVFDETKEDAIAFWHPDHPDWVYTVFIDRKTGQISDFLNRVGHIPVVDFAVSLDVN